MLRSSQLTVQAALTERMANQPGYFPPLFLKLIGVFETFKHLVIEMELVDSNTSDLFQLMRSREKLNELDAADYIHNILYAVRGMQCLNIAHRDIKLANLMVTNNESEVFVKLGDYGMANFAGNGDGLLLGRCGTPGYVAPEILKAGKNVGYSNRVDVFSTGVVMYTLLCGYEPFYGETDTELVECNKRAKVVFEEEDWGGISSEAKRLIVGMLDCNPETRMTPDEVLCSPWFKESEISEVAAEGSSCVVF